MTNHLKHFDDQNLYKANFITFGRWLENVAKTVNQDDLISGIYRY